jgi:hypothetical protein
MFRLLKYSKVTPCSRMAAARTNEEISAPGEMNSCLQAWTASLFFSHIDKTFLLANARCSRKRGDTLCHGRCHFNTTSLRTAGPARRHFHNKVRRAKNAEK